MLHPHISREGASNDVKVLRPILLGTAPVLNSMLEKRVSFRSSFRALSTDTSFIKIGVCYQKLSTLEFNFHYHNARAVKQIMGSA